ncbi:hypothetical protein BC828DRAFT_381951 [Blastocladiella britannica]|nr:hypothetical protein BC828DRAFT_381951 [Blastocladiella britannica]
MKRQMTNKQQQHSPDYSLSTTTTTFSAADVSGVPAPIFEASPAATATAGHIQNLLQGYGPSHSVDYAALRRQFERLESESDFDDHDDPALSPVSAVEVPLDMRSADRSRQQPPQTPLEPRAGSPIARRPDLSEFGADGLSRVLSAAAMRSADAVTTAGSRMDVWATSPASAQMVSPSTTVMGGNGNGNGNGNGTDHARGRPVAPAASTMATTTAITTGNTHQAAGVWARAHSPTPSSPRRPGTTAAGSPPRADSSDKSRHYSEFYFPPSPHHRHRQHRDRTQDRTRDSTASLGGTRITATRTRDEANASRHRTVPSPSPATSAPAEAAVSAALRRSGVHPHHPRPAAATETLTPSESFTDPTPSTSTGAHGSGEGTSSASFSNDSLGSLPRRSAQRRAHRSRALHEISQFLVTKGLPPLPPNVIDSNLPESVQVSLDHAMAQLMNEYHQRGNLIQHLVKQLSGTTAAAESGSGGGATQAAATGSSAATTRPSGHDTGLRPRLDRIVRSAQQQPPPRTGAAPPDAMSAAHQDAMHLQVKYQQLLAKSEREEAEASLLRQELAAVAFKLDQKRARAEATFRAASAQRARPDGGALDRVTQEVMDVYETKVSAMQDELAGLRKMVRKMTTDGDEGGDGRGLTTPPPVAQDEPPADQFLRLKHTLEQQIGLLQRRLEMQAEATRKAEEERDLLQLQMLNGPKTSGGGFGPSSSSASTRPRAGSMGTTRDLIRRDRLHYQLKLNVIDEMPAENVRELLKDVCIRLHLDDVFAVIPALEECARVVAVVPKMQEYIRKVDSLVWRRGSGFSSPKKAPPASAVGKGARPAKRGKPFEHDKDKGQQQHQTEKEQEDEGMHKTSATYKCLEQWAADLDVLQHTRTLLNKITKAVELDADTLVSGGGIGLTSTDSDAELLLLEEIKRLVAYERNMLRVERKHLREGGGADARESAVYQRIVAHFTHLFEVPTVDGVFPKLNELFVFVTEAEAGIARLRDLLGMPDVKPSTVLSRAADELLLVVTAASRADYTSTSIGHGMPPPSKKQQEGRRESMTTESHRGARSVTPRPRPTNGEHAAAAAADLSAMGSSHDQGEQSMAAATATAAATAASQSAPLRSQAQARDILSDDASWRQDYAQLGYAAEDEDLYRGISEFLDRMNSEVGPEERFFLDDMHPSTTGDGAVGVGGDTSTQ